jgi:hypothetical protein
MGSIRVVILEIRPKYSAQILFTKDNDTVATSLPNASVPICGALWSDGTPISGGAGNLALLTLVVGAMLLHRSKSRINGGRT